MQEESVITVQRIGIADRVLGWMFVPIFIGSVLVSVFLLAMAVNFLINPMASDFAGDTSPVFVYLLLAPVMVFGLWVVGALASDAWASPARFELDELGITQIPAGEGHVTIRWQDARFLEEAVHYRPKGRQIARQVYYLLYGNDAVMHIDPKSSYFSSELWQLLARIKEHTGLVPRKFDQPRVRRGIARHSRMPHIER